MGIFGSTNAPERLFGMRVNQSQYGYAFPVVMGTGQVQQSLLWVDGFSSKKSSAGAKGIFGKSGQYLYSADVVVGLVAGEIVGIGDVWSGQSWLGNPTAAETYTIESPYTYTPVNASNLLNDLGVYLTMLVDASYDDLGAPSATVLDGDITSPLEYVPYGTSPAAGQYTINPANNEYIFSSANAGAQVTLSYTYKVTTINQQETDIVPSGKQITVIPAQGAGDGATMQSDGGVVYGPNATNPGQAFTKVTGTPSAAGTYSVGSFGGSSVTYKFASGDINQEVVITTTTSDPNAVGQGETTQLDFTTSSGAIGQSPFSFLSSSYPDAAFSYSGIACALFTPMDLGYSGDAQQIRYEVITADRFGGGVIDCNPVECIGRVLTDTNWGLGLLFPSSVIDNGSEGTWGAASATAGTALTNSTAFNWFAAQGFFISPVIDSQDTAATQIGKWLEAGMCAAFMSEGLMKLVPYGDTTTAGNGYVWEAPQEYVVELDDTCFIAQENDDPVKFTRTSAADAWNVVQVQWNNRENQYAPEITQESDQASINRWGERREEPQDWDFIHTVASATFAANMRLKHGLYGDRVECEFTLPFIYSYLEPMDVVSISTTSVWAQGLNNENLALTDVPVRITKIVDDPQKGLQISGIVYTFGAHQPTLYNKQLNEAEVAADAFADPGDSEVVLFAASGRLAGYPTQGQIWIGALGVSDQWGSCNIWASTDGDTYQQIGTIDTPARLGVLGAAFASGSDPDTAHSLVIDLAENCGEWQAGTEGDANLGNTLTFVDGEIVSYSALTYTGQNQITCGTYIRRGQMGTAIASHAAGGLVMRLDDAIFKYTYDPAYAGQTIYFKFQSVNAFGNNAQELSGLAAVSVTIPSGSSGTVDAESGLVLPAFGGGTEGNLLQNPDFSVPGLAESAAAWWEGGVADFLAGDAAVGQPWRFRSNSLSNYGNCGYTQEIAVSPGDVYVFDFWAYYSESAAAWFLYVANYGDAQTFAVNQGPNAWRHYTFVYTVPSGEDYSGVIQPFWVNGSSTADIIYLWNPVLQKVRSADSGVISGETYLTMPSPPAMSGANNGSLSNSGTATVIEVGAGTYWFGNITIDANSGSVDPGSYGTWYVYFTLPENGFVSGTISPTYKATATSEQIVQNPYNVYIGSITTVSGGGGSGGGSGYGGYSKSQYPPPMNWCVTGDAEVLTPDGWRRIDSLPAECEIRNLHGTLKARLVRHEGTAGAPLYALPSGARVTGNHLVWMKGLAKWSEARHCFPAAASSDALFNLRVETSDPEHAHYVLRGAASGPAVCVYDMEERPCEE